MSRIVDASFGTGDGSEMGHSEITFNRAAAKTALILERFRHDCPSFLRVKSRALQNPHSRGPLCRTGQNQRTNLFGSAKQLLRDTYGIGCGEAKIIGRAPCPNGCRDVRVGLNASQVNSVFASNTDVRRR